MKVCPNDLNSPLNQIYSGEKNSFILRFIFCLFFASSIVCLYFVILGLYHLEIFIALPYPVLFCLRWFLIFGNASEFWNLLGYAFFTTKKIESKKVPHNFKGTLVVQFVSRGLNSDLLLQSARAAYSQKNIFSSLKLEIRLVTEKPIEHLVPISEKKNYTFVEVPCDFECKNGSMYKARGLEYARIKCDEDANPESKKWILFMDEESLLTSSAARGVLNFILEDKEQALIGEGLITYTGGTFGKPFLISAVDCNRVGWDIGRLYCQFALFNDLYFAFHGSFFVASTKLINQIGFDLGKDASVAEDICFAGIAAKRGHRFRWIEGFVREQSPETFIDFLKQRRRWIRGSAYFIFCNRFPLRSRLSVALNNIVLRFAPLASFVLLASVDVKYLEYDLILVAYLCTLRPSQLMGILFTFHDCGIDSTFKKIFVAILFILFSPFAILLETIASVYAVTTNEDGFHVIQKTPSINPMPAREVSL